MTSMKLFRANLENTACFLGEAYPPNRFIKIVLLNAGIHRSILINLPGSEQLQIIIS